MDYFHQVDDPYSHLAVQKLEALRAAYDLPFRTHLVSRPEPAFLGSHERYDAWALRDARSVAEAYGTSLPAAVRRPGPAAVRAANDALAPLRDRLEFAAAAIRAGEELWSSRAAAPGSREGPGEAALRAGDALRERLGHYLGGMFHFDGEWFWGLDRLRLLERRLIDEGFAGGTGDVRVPEPEPADTTGLTASRVVLEYFLSLRSPYTAVGHRRVLDLAARSGVTLRLRPVLPMMMRGIPAPRAKQRYIIVDAAREARARGIPFGRIVDPLGEPVERALALYPAAAALGRETPYVTEYLSAAWADGVDIVTPAGLRRVVTGAGMDWDELRAAARGSAWQALLEDNLNAMLAAGLWGVPSFRISGGRDERPFACWGQDRIWRVENEIANRV
ncbi:MAG: DsbA family protein [Proteobacteria bacterium]|nr:DsbA family protein [Pseudomonadota bacterium]